MSLILRGYTSILDIFVTMVLLHKAIKLQNMLKSTVTVNTVVNHIKFLFIGP